MSKYSKEACDQLMKNVTMAERAITVTGAQLLFWKKHATEIVNSWDQEFRAADMEKRLILVYLADNVVQTSKQQGRHYLEAFNTLLPEAFKHMVKHSDTRVQQKLKHLVDVWRQRKVWGNKMQGKYDDMVKGIDTTVPVVSSPAKPAGGAVAPGDPLAALYARQKEIVQLSQQGQALMAADVQARKALEDAKARGGPATQQQALLQAAVGTAAALHKLNTHRVGVETAARAEIQTLADAKSADVARCQQRATASEAALQELQTRANGGVALPPGLLNASAATQSAAGASQPSPLPMEPPAPRKVDPRKAARAAAAGNAAAQPSGAAPSEPVDAAAPEAAAAASQGADAAADLDVSSLAAAQLAAMDPHASAKLLSDTLGDMDPATVADFENALREATVSTGQTS